MVLVQSYAMGEGNRTHIVDNTTENNVMIQSMLLDCTVKKYNIKPEQANLFLFLAS